MTVVYAMFDLEFRAKVVYLIKTGGHIQTTNELVDGGWSPVFAKALVKNILRKEGW